MMNVQSLTAAVEKLAETVTAFAKVADERVARVERAGDAIRSLCRGE
jgi:hypothetical protein